MDFISDLTKEVTKDVIGQTIFYYKIREDVSEVHEIYEEAEKCDAAVLGVIRDGIRIDKGSRNLKLKEKELYLDQVRIIFSN